MMRFKKNKGQQGVTLVELLFAVVLMGIIIQVSYSIFFVGTKSFQTGVDRGMNQDDFRMLREVLAKELRNASYLGLNEPDSSTSQDKSYSTYYSLEIEKDLEEGYYLLKKEYPGNGNSKLPKLPDEISNMKFSYSEGMIKVATFLLGEESSKEFNILAENHLRIDGSIELSLGKKIFYAYPKDEILPEPAEDETNPEDDE